MTEQVDTNGLATTPLGNGAPPRDNLKRTSLKFTIRLLLWGGLSTLGLATLIFLLLAHDEYISVEASIHEPLCFEIRAERAVVSITILALWSETKREYLWVASINSLPKKVRYGELQEEWKQIRPGDKKKPRPILNGEIVYVSVTFIRGSSVDDAI